MENTGRQKEIADFHGLCSDLDSVQKDVSRTTFEVCRVIGTETKKLCVTKCADKSGGEN